MDKNSYMGSEFNLLSLTIDHLMQELTKIGKGAHFFKIGISRAFRHLTIDPMDYHLLGLRLDATYIVMCVPFGSRHRSQIIQ